MGTFSSFNLNKSSKFWSIVLLLISILSSFCIIFSFAVTNVFTNGTYISYYISFSFLMGTILLYNCSYIIYLLFLFFDILMMFSLYCGTSTISSFIISLGTSTIFSTISISSVSFYVSAKLSPYYFF